MLDVGYAEAGPADGPPVILLHGWPYDIHSYAEVVPLLAAHGYPMSPRKGDAITGLPEDADDAMVFHAGTAVKDGQTVTTGGRVLCVTALADSVRQAQQRAYGVIQGLHFDGMQYRRDIGHRAVKS